MKLSFNIIFLSLFLSMTTFAVTFTDAGCEEVDGLEGFFSKDIDDSTNYALVLGFGDDIPLTPDEIEVIYSDSSCTTIVKYHAHNGDTAQGDSSVDERNIFYSIGAASSTKLTVKERISSSRTNHHWIMYGSAILTTNNYQITFNESATSEDPFNGIVNNATSFIQARVNFGTSDSPCVAHSLKETADSTTGTITFSGQGGAACSFTITTSDSSVYSAEMDVEGAAVTFESDGTISPALAAELKNQDNATVGTIEFNYNTITFKDNSGSLFE